MVIQRGVLGLPTVHNYLELLVYKPWYIIFKPLLIANDSPDT